MKLLNFTIIKLTLCLIAGIIIAFYVPVSFELASLLLLVSAIGLCLSYLFFGSQSKLKYVFSIFTFLTFISVGIFNVKIHDERLHSSHYMNSEIQIEARYDYSFSIKKRLKPDNYNNKYIVEIRSLNSQKSSGQVLLNLNKDSLKTDLKVGQLYFTNTKLSEVVKPKNPFQFDYNNYLKKRNIYHQFYLDHSTIIQLYKSEVSLYSYADDFREKVSVNLEKSGFDKDALSIINALLLGQRQDISSEIYNNYVNAGVIHILAVSGLHVGIIFLILSWLFKPLHRLKYSKHLLKPILIITILWGFAFVAGLSPSVTRAVTMFSIITCAQFLKRPTNIYNTLTISAFVMLLFNPIYLFDIGFQMSYLAVLAIVSIQPMLYGLITIPYKIPDYFWQIFTVTLAAQIGVAPISLFYFHQFPGLFFVSNLVIIPAVTVILALGIPLIALAFFNAIPNFMVKTFNYIINSLNDFIGWIAQFEDFLFRDLPFNIYYVFCSYLFIVSGLQLWKNQSYKVLKYTLLSVLLFSGVTIYTKYENSRNELVVFNKSRKTVIGKKQNSQLLFHHNLDSISYNNDKTLKNYKVGNFIYETSSDSLSSIYTFNSELLLVIDSLGVYNTSSFKPEYVLITNSPKLNLNRLIDSLQPKTIIADASNYKSYVQRWKATCINKKIPFHSTYEKGAFVLK